MVKTSRGQYPIYIGQGLLKGIGDTAGEAWSGIRAMIVSDSNAAPLYLDTCRTSLLAKGFEVSTAVVGAGESSKSPSVLAQLYQSFYSAGLTRTDGVIALGGGVVGDLAGFAAATFLRGIPLIQAPTTLLAQVDSAIGGKTGIDLAMGKNMVGAFYPPRAVVMDTDTLSTLPPRRRAEGMAEVIKYGCIGDAKLFATIENNAFTSEAGIPICIDIKASIVGRDEYDTGERLHLNFGHTIGHAVEKATGFTKYTHGEAVAMGMVAAVRIGEARGITAPGIVQRLTGALGTWDLPVELPIPAQEVLPALSADKKQLGDEIHFVFIKDIGQPHIYPISLQELSRIVEEVCYHG